VRQRVRLLLPLCLSGGRTAFTAGPAEGLKECQKTTKKHTHTHTYPGMHVQNKTHDGESCSRHSHKMLHKHRNIPVETHLLFIHTFLFTSCCFFLFHTNNLASSQPNHNYKSQGQITRSRVQGQWRIKIKSVICSHLSCNGSIQVKWYNY